MEVTREHLQNQLNQKEMECEQFRKAYDKMHRESTAQTAEAEHYQGILAATRDKSMRDKEALKKATRLQRERAQKTEEDNEKLQNQINSLLIELDQSKATLQEITEVHKTLKAEREFLEDESSILRKNILDIGETLELSSKTMKSGAVHVVEKLTNKVRHLKSVKLENENLKVNLFIFCLFFPVVIIFW
jgi:hypothetical protein